MPVLCPAGARRGEPPRNPAVGPHRTGTPDTLNGVEPRHLTLARRRIWIAGAAGLLVLGPLGLALGGWVPFAVVALAFVAATSVLHWKAATWLASAVERGRHAGRRDTATFCVVIAVSGYAQPSATSRPPEDVATLRLEAYRAAAHDDLSEDIRLLAADALAAADQAHAADTPLAWREARARGERLAHAAQDGNPYVRRLLIQWVEEHRTP
ncbi:hypothetical protein GCM10010358_49250 [Streptomyces minutiscleroticus]|uniref:Uncharacterized protein n=1 Tax=Streptomyces minutiscleroticus TaxID=68238 RepID=A0A918NR67_9ACTN|nr:hypothetical protein GCM10010358_49250 [Streptomyces minutiscleroticus]